MAMNENGTAGTRGPELAGREVQLPATRAANARTVRRSFWRKLARVFARIPFAEDLLAAYHCGLDRKTPARVRAVLLAALAYFVIPTDMLPDFIAGFGFSDDATVLATAIGIVSGHITEEHRTAARAALDRLRRGEEADSEAG